MLNIIVYEDDMRLMQKNIGLINRILADYDIDYHIHKFSGFNEEFRKIINTNNIFKIYILDMQISDISGIEVASYIREIELDSIIIFVNAFNDCLNDIFYNRLMVLDYICRYDGYENRLKDDIESIIKIYNKNRIFSFKYNYIMYRIPYSDINYIEKEPLIKRCIIHTQDNQLYIINSIEKLIKILGVNFIKTHQSCIVNIDNILEIDCVKNIIVFKNGEETHLLTDKAKRELKEYTRIN